MYKLAVLISGRGSNFKAILDAINSKIIKDTEIFVVVSNKAEALGINIAKENNIEHYILKKNEMGQEDYDNKLIDLLKDFHIDFILLAGFMRILTPNFVKHYENKILNIHPSLLPSFPGLHAQKQAIEAGVKFSGATVHFVTNKLDNGPIIIQSIVPVYADDTEETLSERILKTEHKIYPLAVKLLVENRLQIVDNKVYVKNIRKSEFYYINPIVLR